MSYFLKISVILTWPHADLSDDILLFETFKEKYRVALGHLKASLS
jgi:hypothetical protein